MTRNEPRANDVLFVTLTRVANRSVLWGAAAAGLALAGGPRGRRAAARGMAAVALASIAVNGPIKQAFRRPRPMRRPPLIRMPRSSSFPSGHSASAFAFATAAGATMPAAAAVLVPLAAAVAYSRVRVGVHRPSEVLLGGALGIASGALVSMADRRRPPASRTTRAKLASGPLASGPPASGLPAQVVLVTSQFAGRSGALESAREQMRRSGLKIVTELDVSDVAGLRDQIRALAPQGPRLVVAAGGDGTVGAVADCLAESEGVLGIVPLGTSNDFARSLGIPIDPGRAVALLTQGKIAGVDLGRLVVPGQPARHFVHAATVGLNVSFAKLATRASVRAHLGRLTYLIAARNALRARPAFACELVHDGHTEKLALTQLSVINAPVFGGALGLSVEGSDPDDRLLDVLAIEDLPVRRLLLAAGFLLLRVKRPLPGVHTFHIRTLHVHTERPLDVALDGEVLGRLPGDFEVVGEALRVITPLDFVDVDGGEAPPSVRLKRSFN
ncbi:MAG TPA: diacylglycerol kinase family protein [Streptosporangiaceae bacterium]